MGRRAHRFSHRPLIFLVVVGGGVSHLRRPGGGWRAAAGEKEQSQVKCNDQQNTAVRREEREARASRRRRRRRGRGQKRPRAMPERNRWELRGRAHTHTQPILIRGDTHTSRAARAIGPLAWASCPKKRSVWRQRFSRRASRRRGRSRARYPPPPCLRPYERTTAATQTQKQTPLAPLAPVRGRIKALEDWSTRTKSAR